MHLKDLTLTEIRLLAALMELRSLSAAASRIGLSQSAASHACTHLRKGLGDSLFVRAAGGIRLTPLGEHVGAAARQALDALAAGLAVATPFDPQQTGRVFNLYLNEVGQMVVLPKLLDFIDREAPGVSLHTHAMTADGPNAPLVSNEVDLAVGFFTNLAAGFHQSLVFRESYVCVVRRHHPRFREGMRLEAFAKTPRALAAPGGMAHGVVERTLKKHGILGEVKLRVPDFMVLPLVVANSDLLAVVPSRLAQTFAKMVPIEVLPPPVSIPSYDIRAFWHDRYDNDPACRWLRRNIIKLFRHE